MSLLSFRPQALPSLCLSLLLLGCVVGEESGGLLEDGKLSLRQGKSGVACDSGQCVSGYKASMTTESLIPTLSPENSRWSLVRTRVMEMVKPLVTRTKDRWQWFWGPEAVQGFVQTYYEDHLKDLGSRTQAWLQSSRDQLLNKTHSLCPRLLCRDRTQG
ncbi:Apolipoprotein C-IV [Cricetulus griseus]|uniref:Apolipoprotein C-IV n=1 Tax=Cricetulus griseus TaxID=10029 RepID=G3HPD0_CRIGR|nr:Apolipoprotein C-IV [Cricetulus griseus]